MKKATGVAIAAALGTAAIMAISSMKPSTRSHMKKGFRETFNHMDDVKDDLCNVREDVTEMARTLKNQM